MAVRRVSTTIPCSAGIAARVRPHLTTSPQLLKDVATRLDDVTLEAIAAMHEDGLAGFLRANSTSVAPDCVVRLEKQNRSGLLSVRLVMRRPMTVTDKLSALESPVVAPREQDSLTGSYNAYRLARYLRTDTFRCVAEVDAEALGALDVPIDVVIRDHPHLFQVIYDANSKSSVKFLLSKELQEKHLVPNKFDAMSADEIDECVKKLRSEGSPKYQQARKRVFRAKQRKLYPLGSPFLDPAVMAHYIHDMLAPGECLSRNKLLLRFPQDVLAQCGPIVYETLSPYPHLLCVNELAGNNIFTVSRVTSEAEAQQQHDSAAATYVDEERDLLPIVAAAASSTTEAKETRDICMNDLTAFCPRRWMPQMRRFFHQLGDRYPNIFSPLSMVHGSLTYRVRVAELLSYVSAVASM